MHDLSALNDDLPEILAMLSVVEEYVCVSNTNVHLLAGIGRSARVLVPYPAEWRWMSRGRVVAVVSRAARSTASRGSRTWQEPLAALRRDLDWISTRSTPSSTRYNDRRASENFIGGDPHDRPMPLDYFVWLIRGDGREIVVDTGFSAAMAAKREARSSEVPYGGPTASAIVMRRR